MNLHFLSVWQNRVSRRLAMYGLLKSFTQQWVKLRAEVFWMG